MVPKLFAYTSGGDLDFSAGLRSTTTIAGYVQQAIPDRLNAVYGEWFRDTRRGLRWFDFVFGHKLDRPTVDTMIRRALLRVPGVASVRSLSLALNSQRSLSISGAVQLVTGEDIEIRDFILEQ